MARFHDLEVTDIRKTIRDAVVVIMGVKDCGRHGEPFLKQYVVML